ncbi:hypothetical protein BGZ95_002167 [Linnemannia exigua]|uniref:Uncharacterized protein n=1 Tax=Linnemannia exigua TaxID=604196 RepID=A0AAD4DIW0_9FUNG|nr:hypothetical protein BGZ95_002167 [Linnemannia exigua]
MQRFRSNSSSSSTIESPLSPTYLSHIGHQQQQQQQQQQQLHPTAVNDKSSTASINIVHSNNNTRRGGPINISAPSLTSPPSSFPRSAYDPPPTPTSPRLPQSPISSAAGVMKKLLRRRRGHTSEDTGLGIVGAGAGAGTSGASGHSGISSVSHGSTASSTSSEAVAITGGLPGGQGMIHSFVIVGGQGAVAAGSTIYDLEPPSPVSPTATTTHMISPPSSSSSTCSTSFSPPTRASSGSMGPLVGTTGMISPRSPTFPQSMMTRFSAGRDHHQQQQQHSLPLYTQTQTQMHMHAQQPIPAGYVTSSSSSSSSTLTSPISIPSRGRSHQSSISNAAAGAVVAASPPVSVIGSSGQVQSLSLSAAHLHRRLDRRSLSADSLWSDKDQLSASSAPITASDQASIAPDMVVHPTTSVDHEQQRPLAPLPPLSSTPSPSPFSSDRHGRIQGDVEFFKKSVEFLRTHHSRHNTADDWANRNKRKAQLPVRRQSESCLLDRATESHVADSANGMLSMSVPDKIECDQWQAEEPRAFGPGSCWKDLDPSYPSMMDFDQLVDDVDRSLLSSVDIILMPTISSPARFYDCPRSRKLVRTYLTSKEREFDEMIEFGFPSASIVDDNRSIASSSSKDCRFLTLRLTLTPWHARADESKLYGFEDPATGVPIKEKVNKFLSRTSAKLSYSPPRILSLLPDARSILSATPDRKMSLTPDSTMSALSWNNGTASPVESSMMVSPLSQTPRTHLDASPASSSQLPPTGSRSIKSNSNNNNNSGPISPAFTGAALPPRREKGFRIMDPSTMSSPMPLTLSTTSTAPLLRTVNSADYLSIDPSSPGLMSSPPSTPSPTTAYHYQPQHPYSQQQHLLLPRKGSLTAMSTYPQQQQTLHSTAHGPRYQHLAPTPPPEMMNSPPPRSRSTSPFVATSNTNNNNNPKPNKFSTSPPSPHPMPGIITTSTKAAPIPIPGSGSRYPHHRPPIYGTSTPTPNATASASPITTTWSETDVFGSPSARIARPRRHDSCDQLQHSQQSSIQQQHQHQQQHQQQNVMSPSTSSASGASSSSSSSSETNRMYIPRTQYAPTVHSH